LSVLGALLALTVSGCTGTTHVAGTATGSAPATGSGAAGVPGSPPSAAPLPAACTGAAARSVDTADQLAAALAGATPGGVIVLRPGSYRGNFVISRSGSPAAPITLCGSRSAILDGGDTGHGYVLHLNRADWWQIAGITLQNGQKGLVADHSNHDVFTGLDIHSVGDEAVHLRSGSSDNIVRDSVISATGLHQSKFGEGVYIGSAHKNWCQYSGCQPDRSDRDLVIGNAISHTTAENIDIKEGTTGGQISRNTLSGAGMDPTAAQAWINVKGNGWIISDNTGTDSVGDGFQVHQVSDGWGEHNVFRANRAQVNGPGYAYYVHHASLGTVVACSNSESGAAAGLSNVACSPG
jgi:hypothetical protein